MYLLHCSTQHVIAFVDGDLNWTQESHQELLYPTIFRDCEKKGEQRNILNYQMLMMVIFCSTAKFFAVYLG